MNVNTIPMEECLDIKKFEELAEELSKLPTAEEFCKKAEDQLWDLVAKTEEDQKIYKSLDSRSKKLIGYTVDDKGEVVLPWWLKSFDWHIQEAGGEYKKIDRKFLKNDMEKYHVDCYIKKPIYNQKCSHSDSKLPDLLSTFDWICKEIQKAFDLSDPDDTYEKDTPDIFFEWTDNGIRTTDEFKRWFDHILSLCPPCQPQLTSLLMLYSGVDIQRLEIDNDESLIKLIRPLNELSNHPKIVELSNINGVFDVKIDYPDGYSDYHGLTPLEILFLIAFKESFDEIGNKDKRIIREWITKASDDIRNENDYLGDSDLREFAAIALAVPIYIETGKPERKMPSLLFSRGRRTNYPIDKMGTYKNYNKIYSIRELLKALGLLEEND